MSETPGPASAVAEQARDRIVRLIDFLKSYDAQKNPPVTDIDTYRLFAVRGERIPDVPPVTMTPGAPSWLSVGFVDLPASPAVPDELTGYLPPPERLSPTVRPEPAVPPTELVLPQRDDVDGDEADGVDAVAEPTETGLAQLAAAQHWVTVEWEPWSTAWRQAQRAKEFYRLLFEQQQLIGNDRETYELVWGFGRLGWTSDGIRVNHPLFTTAVEVVTGEDNALTVAPVQPLELETLPFAAVALADRAQLAAIRDSVAAEPFDPWTTEVLTSRVRAVVRALHHEGVLDGEGAPQPSAPVADTGWVMYTRRRRPDRQGFLDAMRELYDSGVLPPDALSSIVVDAPSSYAVADYGAIDVVGGGPPAAAAGQLEPLLLPLPSNEEQQRILRLAQRQSGVVVQGPPGTGKSHTIANLVSHYVAYGHRVLVVAEKEQALNVLGGKIPAEIRELAVAVLGSDDASRRALETTIASIQGRVSNLDRSLEDRRIVELKADLAAGDAAIARATDRLLQARRSETDVLAGQWPVQPASPERVAAWVSEHHARLGYIPDPLPADLPVPLTRGEFAELQRLLAEVGLQRARETAFVLPDLNRLPTETDVADLVARRDQLRAALTGAAPEIDSWDAIDAASPARIARVRETLEEEESAADTVGEMPWLAAIAAQQHDALLTRDWRSFLEAVAADRQQVLGLRPALAAHNLELPADPPPTFAGHLEEARQRLSERGKLGMFAGDVKRAVDACRVDGAVPATADAVALCQWELHLRQLRRALRTRWLNQVAPFGGPDLDPSRPEDTVGALLGQLTSVLDAPGRWQQLTAELLDLGVTLGSGHASSTIRRLRVVADLAVSRASERSVTAQLNDLAAYLAAGASGSEASRLWQLLADALASELPASWGQFRSAVSDLIEISAAARRLNDLGDRLYRAAPVWTNAIYTDPTAVPDASTLAEAWQWRQLDTWVASIAAGDDPQRLQLELEQLTASRRRLVAELVGVQAWRRLADNLGDRQRQALNHYLAATRRYGKTGGKFAARWRAEIRAALNDSKDAVPVWIMTTATALASFRPDAQPPFDVLIIDEASQIGIEALPLLALARRAIVVGDDKQTSPGAVGVDQQSVFNLIDAHLSDVPGHRVMFTPGNSLYDLAGQKFPSLVMLREHFRCLPEIIAFSNRFYGDKIEPLREDRPAPGWPALGTVKVLDGYLDRSTDTNEPEANVVVDLIAKMIDDPTYDGMNFGVVCLRAGAQNELIDRKLFERLGPQVIRERRLRVGDAPNFQGDERDVVVVATVVGTDPANPTSRIGAMTSAADEQRINVAASRARNQMIVVHSTDPERLPSNDLRAALIRHCRAPLDPGTDSADALERCDSEFERRVLRRIIARGYARVRAQVHAGSSSSSYRIDLVVDGPESRLAVECDGERWHGEDRWHADRARQDVLERAGWKFCRIRGSAFFRDPDAALEPLWQRLDELGIPTGADWLEAGLGPQPTVIELRGSDRTSSEPSAPYVEDTHYGAASAPSADGGPSASPPVAKTDDPMPLAAPAALADPKGAPATGTVQAPSDSEASPTYGITRPPTPPGPPAPPAQPGAPARPQVAAARLQAGTELKLATYRTFHDGPFVPVALDTRSQVAAGLRAIVAAEGPVLALRAYQLYVIASGGQRVGTEIKRILNEVAYDQIHNGHIAQIDEPIEGMIDRTLYVPDTAAVIVRELGPRDLHEVPKSEVHALITVLGMVDEPDTDRVSRAVLDAYGLRRMGSRAGQFLLECQRYASRQA